MAVRSNLKRAGAALVGASALVALSALPASAEATSGRVVKDAGENGYSIDVGGDRGPLGTTLMDLKLADSDKVLKVYCVEVNVAARFDRDMVEHEWEKYPGAESPFNKHRDKINWVLHHSYPVQDVKAIEKSVADAGISFDDGLDVKEAVTATQAATWHYSDGRDLNKQNPLPDNQDETGAARDIVKLYEYLTGDANKGIGDQPTPALEVGPKELDGEAGGKVGPFEVKTNGEITEFTSNLPEGVKVTDEAGAELALEDITDGVKFWIDVPAEAEEGKGEVSLKAHSEVATGRLFVADDYKKDPAQSLIVAKSDKSDLKAQVSAKWTPGTPDTTPPSTTTPAPSTTDSAVVPPVSSTSSPKPKPVSNEDDLADTGASIMTPILIGVGLLAAGGGALYLQRRRSA
ncbi:TQXA domain protein [Amycolatopsis antarctica]|uniref:TQXA domain protein n=1 Tax=Amycolatopsis antarctica TaxID=1854586 RepID=A0A263D2A4_9PSEU|nr:thioester domain-containing protein [Amycolatopsis antarctica]OZM72590.1 TQXA domain protein [Amycolatopsis antarctica]